MAKKICDICKVRPADTKVISGMCAPCYDEGSWENQHQDDGHDELADIATKAMWQVEGVYQTGAVELRKLAPKVGIKNAGKHKSAELRQMIVAAVVEAQSGCWICHPELNEAKRERKTRKAPEGERPSRKGQVINVPLRAMGEEKAEVVRRKLAEAKITGKVSREFGSVVLTVKAKDVEVKLAWLLSGPYLYEDSSVTVGGKSKKVRNVAEALRILAGA